MSEKSNVSLESHIKQGKSKEERIYLRNYSKVIFLYPLFITSLILFIIQNIIGIDEPGFGAIWITVFFANLFVIAFDTSSTKFLILLLIAIILIIIFTFIFHPDVIISEILSFEVLIVMSTQFYLASAVILAVVLLFAWIITRFNYWKLERNEVIHRNGIFVSVSRYPTKNLRIKKDIPDLFEFLLLRAGSIQLFLGNQEVVQFDTILNINKKAKQIDYLLSDIEVEVESK